MHNSEASAPDTSHDKASATSSDLQGGMRDWVADWVMARQDMIRHLARQRLARNTRTLFDSEDIFSTVLTRMDGLAARGVLRVESPAEMTALVKTIVANSTANKARLIARSRRLEAEDGDYARHLLGRLQRCIDDDEATLVVCRMMAWLDSQEARQILGLRLRGMTHGAIGQALGMNEAAVRKRWQAIRATLMERIGLGELE